MAFRRAPRTSTVRLRGLEVQLTRWGPDAKAGESPVLLLHGWQDVGATFQFMVDALDHDWPLVALDWRGFGGSEWASDGYWFPDYLADLDALLDALSPAAPAPLVGHSMGGNIACLYAGLKPDRVRCVVSLEGFGQPRTTPTAAPLRLRQWLGQVKSRPGFKEYESLAQLRAIIRLRYPRFSEAQTDFLAVAWSEPLADGRVRLRGDPRHRWVNPVLYKREDAEACWREVRAPLLMVIGEVSEYVGKLGADGTATALRDWIPHIDIAHVPAAGHMLHIEQPLAVATLVERFLTVHAASSARSSRA